MLEFIQSGSFRRILAGAAASLALLFHKKLGIEVEPEALVTIGVIAATYIVGGNVKEAALANGKAATERMATTEETAEFLGGKVEERK